MSQILDEYKNKLSFIEANRTYFRLFIFGVVVILLGIDAGFLFFGKSSLDVLLGLQAQQKSLESRIDSLKNENAKLQKELFELQQLDPDFNKGR